MLKNEDKKRTTDFIKMLGLYKKTLPRRVILTLRGQALSGDIEGAVRGLNKIISRKNNVQ